MRVRPRHAFLSHLWERTGKGSASGPLAHSVGEGEGAGAAAMTARRGASDPEPSPSLSHEWERSPNARQTSAFVPLPLVGEDR